VFRRHVGSALIRRDELGRELLNSWLDRHGPRPGFAAKEAHRAPQPLPPRVSPPVPARHAATLSHQDVLSGCVWDTKPVLPHQEGVPASGRTPRNGRLPGYVLLLRRIGAHTFVTHCYVYGRVLLGVSVGLPAGHAGRRSAWDCTERVVERQSPASGTRPS
jgi:hypothetical protein